MRMLRTESNKRLIDIHIIVLPDICKYVFVVVTILFLSQCVTIGQCCLFVMDHSGRGSVFSMLWATVGGLGLPGNLVSLRETAAGLVAVSCGDR